MAADAGSGGNGGNDGVVFVTDRAKEAHCASPQEGVGQGVSGFRFRPRGGEGMEEEKPGQEGMSHERDYARLADIQKPSRQILKSMLPWSLLV